MVLYFSFILTLFTPKLFNPVLSYRLFPLHNSSHSIQENPVRGDETPSLLQDQMLDPSNEESSLASSTSWHVTRRMIYVRSNPKVAVGHWPIPEGFWPDPGAQNMVSLLDSLFLG